MRHPALRRSARHSARRDARPDPAKLETPPEAAAEPAATAVIPATEEAAHDPAGQNRPAPGTPPDGDHNQGGVRREGIDYQRDLGSEQDA